VRRRWQTGRLRSIFRGAGGLPALDDNIAVRADREPAVEDGFVSGRIFEAKKSPYICRL